MRKSETLERNTTPLQFCATRVKYIRDQILHMH